mgnify:FL=1
MATDKESIEIVSEEVVKPKAKPRAKAKPKAKAAPKEVIPEIIEEEIIEAVIEEVVVAATEEIAVELVTETIAEPVETEVPVVVEAIPDFFFSEKNPNFITAMQKKFIKQLFQTRDYPASEVYAAFESLVSNLDNPEIRVYPDTIKQHYVTKREADILISKLSSYSFRKKA